MEIRIVTDSGAEMCSMEGSTGLDRIAALGPGQLFGAFELGASDADARALEGARARASRAWWADVEDGELAASTVIGRGTHGRGALVVCGSEALVLTPTGRAYRTAGTLDGLLELAARPEYAGSHGLDSSTPRGASLLDALRRTPIRPPRVLDRRSKRGTAGFIEALDRSDDEADALLPLLLEADDLMLATFHLREAVRARRPERTDYAKQLDRMGAHHENWTKLGTLPEGRAIPDPVLELVAAGWGKAGDPVVVAPFGRSDLMPRSVRERLDAALGHWRDLDATRAAAIEAAVGRMRASDVYFATRVLDAASHDQRQERPRLEALAAGAEPVIELLRADRMIAARIDALLAHAAGASLVPLLDLLLTRRLDRTRWHVANDEQLIPSRLRLRDECPIDVARLRAEVAAWLAAPDAPSELAVSSAVMLLGSVAPVALAELTVRHTKLIAEVTDAARLVALFCPPTFTGQEAGPALLALARCRELATDEKLLAAKAAKTLGIASAAALVETLEKRWNAELKKGL
jgi:hypothetical protein